jgi:hypothetical protein
MQALAAGTGPGSVLRVGSPGPVPATVAVPGWHR